MCPDHSSRFQKPCAYPQDMMTQSLSPKGTISFRVWSIFCCLAALLRQWRSSVGIKRFCPRLPSSIDLLYAVKQGAGRAPLLPAHMAPNYLPKWLVIPGAKGHRLFAIRILCNINPGNTHLTDVAPQDSLNNDPHAPCKFGLTFALLQYSLTMFSDLDGRPKSTFSSVPS